MSKARDIADLDFNSPDIDGGNIDGATIGGTTPAAGAFSSVIVNGVSTLNTSSTVFANLNYQGATKGTIGTDGINIKHVANANMYFHVNGQDRMLLGGNGDISIYDSSSNAKIFWDASDSRLGINNTSPNSFSIGDLVIGNGSSAPGVTLYSSNTAEGIIRFADGTSGNEQYRGQIKYSHAEDSLNFHANAASSSAENLILKASEAVFNEGGIDTDFRVESDSNPNMLFVDGGNDRVGIGTNSPKTLVDIYDATLPVLRLTNGRNEVSGTDYDLGKIEFFSRDSSGTGQRVLTEINAIADAGSTAPGGIFTIKTAVTNSAAVERVRFDAGHEVVFNDTGTDTDFRVESAGNANMLIVDAGKNTVGIGTTASVDETLTVQGEIRASGNDGAVRVDSGSGGYYLNLTQTYAHPYSNSYIQSVAGSSYHGRLIFQGNTSGGSMEEFLRMSTAEGVIFNEGGIDKDFRVESNNDTHTLFVDGGNDTVFIKTTSTPANGTDLVVEKSYGIGGQTTKTYVTAINLGGNATHNIGTFTGNAGNTCSAHLVGAHHYSTASTGTGAPISVYQKMSVCRLDGTGSAYANINNVEIGSSSQGGASPPTLEFTSSGVLRVTTGIHQGCYAQVTVVHHGTFTPA